MPIRYGAQPEEWAHLDLVCGLTQDLLPVVSNPNALISDNSSLKTLGKVPSKYNGHHKAVGIKDWTSCHTGGHEIERWLKEPDYGACLQTREVRAIDIDMERSAPILNVLRDLGYSLPLRKRANSGKCLVAFRVGGEIPKRVIRCEDGIIEFLATGQQFIAAGTHTSGVRYEWDWNGYVDFPELTLEQFEAIWLALEKEFAASGFHNAASGMRHARDVSNLGINDPILSLLPVIGWGSENQAYLECPWKAGHSTDSGITECCYFPMGGRGYKCGHFRCLHASCAHRTDEEFLDAYGLRAAEFDIVEDELEKKVFNIQLTGGNLHKEIETAEEALLSAGVPYYQRGPALVRPVIETVSAAYGRKTHTAQLFTIDVHYLVQDLCRSATWLQYKTKKWVKVNAPDSVAIKLLANYGHWRFPRITGIISAPTLRPDGSILSEEGFDEETGLLLTGSPAVPPVSVQPSMEDARQALDSLKSLLTEFPFVNAAARSVALSALITPVVRGAFPCAPMHVVRAPTPGSGKSYLLDVASAIALGQPCPVMAAGRTEEETEKRLGAVLMTGQPIISVDNVNGTLGGDFLCQLIERPVVEVRILGKSQVMKLESRSTVFATGNNISLLGDMTRRVILCMMDAGVERPELRRFTSNPVDRVLAERGKYIAAALTIVRAYIAAGRPNRAPSIASFAGWSDSVRSALIWLGEPDPVETMELARDEDPVLQNMMAVFSGMRDCIGLGKAMTAAQILRTAQAGDGTIVDETEDKFEMFFTSLVNATSTAAGYINAKHLGRWLGSYKGRIAGGLKLHSSIDKHSHMAIWWVDEDETLC